MIIDQTPLAGTPAYLADAAGSNLALPAGVAERVGLSPRLREGAFLQVSSLDVHLEGGDLEALFAAPTPPTSDGDPPRLLELRVRKELFPLLFADPYRVRVHTIAGMDDFQRGRARNMEAMDVDGTVSLVSLGAEQCGWGSAVYKLPEPAQFNAAAWEIPSARLARRGAFTYSLKLEVWRGTAPLDGPPEIVVLAEAATSDAPRKAEGLAILGTNEAVTDVRAYRLMFTANVRHDAAMIERYSSANDKTPSRGRALLTAVHLLENVRSAFAFDNLHELVGTATSVHLFDAGAGPLKRLRATLPLVANLGEGEDVAVIVRGAEFTRVEARLSASRLTRPPAARDD